MEQQDITIQLWAYIDGLCDEETCAHVQQRIATDAVWQHKYNELLALNAELEQTIELQEPSMRFTRNVMDLIEATQQVPSIHKYTNPVIIRSIAAFFALSLLITTIYSFIIAGSDRSIATRHVMATPLNNIAFKAPDINTVLNSNTITILLCVNVVLGLLFLDTFLRSRLHTNRK